MTEQAPHQRPLDGGRFWIGFAVVVVLAVGVLAVKCSAGATPAATAPATPLRVLRLATLAPAPATMTPGELARIAVNAPGPYDTVYEGVVDQANPAVEVISISGEQPQVQARHRGTVVVSVLVGGSCASAPATAPASASSTGSAGPGQACSHLRRSLGTVQITVTG